MPSKTSKKRPNPLSQWKSARDCSEAELALLASELARLLRPGDRVLLNGPMGVGKTFFARGVLLGLGVVQPPEGSPSFALAHEYQAPIGRVAHVDFYRIRSESEIEDAGLPSYFWENPGITLAEWTSMWPGFETALLKAARCWVVNLEFADAESHRHVQILAPDAK